MTLPEPKKILPKKPEHQGMYLIVPVDCGGIDNWDWYVEDKYFWGVNAVTREDVWCFWKREKFYTWPTDNGRECDCEICLTKRKNGVVPPATEVLLLDVTVDKLAGGQE